jgi:hypothetical protein
MIKILRSLKSRLIISSIFLIFFSKIFLQYQDIIKFSKSDFTQNEKFNINFTEEVNSKINKIFIKFDGNLHNKTAFFPEKIEFYDGEIELQIYSSNNTLRTGYYETTLKNPVDIDKLKLKLSGKNDWSISNILLIENNNIAKINLIKKIFDPKNLNEFSYVTYSLFLILYFTIFSFFIKFIISKLFLINLEIILIIPIFVIYCILLNFFNILFKNTILYLNFFVLIFIFIKSQKFMKFIQENKFDFVILILIFLIIQLPIIFRDFAFNYFGNMKLILYENNNLYLKNGQFLGYHFDSNLVWITSKILQNVESFINAKDIFTGHFIPFENIYNRSFIFHNFFSYFFELLVSNFHFLFARLQYFFLAIVFFFLFLIAKEKLNFKYSLIIIMCLALNPAVHFNSFPSFETINKVFPFIFFSTAILLFEYKKINLSMLSLIFGGLLHITGLFYVLIFIFFLISKKNFSLLKYTFVLILVFFFHLKLNTIISQFFYSDNIKNFYFSNVNIDGNFLYFIKVKAINLANYIIPFFNIFNVSKTNITFNQTIFYCLLTATIFFFKKYKSENFFSFFLLRFFLISPILLLAIFDNKLHVNNSSLYYFQIFNFFYTLFYYFQLSNKDKIFFYNILSLFLIITFNNLINFINLTFNFNSKENYFLLLLFIFLALVLNFYIKKNVSVK